MTPKTVNPERLIDFATQVNLACGQWEADARLCADSLVQADLWGHQSHGVMRLSWYAARMKAGVCDAKAAPEVILDGGALALIDGHDAMGQVVAAKAVEETIRRAKRYGVAAVGMRNSNHFGTAMYFTRRLAEAGYAGFLSTNASPSMAPWGGRKKLLGNNPWSWACPAGAKPPMMLDMANTGVARGKIYLARQKGELIPSGWAIDADGVPTTDPAKAIDGIILPMGQHKGYAITAMMDMLSGALTGSGMGPEVSGPYQYARRSRAGHFMIAIDIAALQPLADFNARIEAMIAGLKAVPLAQGFDEVFYPGEIEARNDEKNRRDGLVLPDDTIADLAKLADEYGLEQLAQN